MIFYKFKNSLLVYKKVMTSRNNFILLAAYKRRPYTSKQGLGVVYQVLYALARQS